MLLCLSDPLPGQSDPVPDARPSLFVLLLLLADPAPSVPAAAPRSESRTVHPPRLPAAGGLQQDAAVSHALGHVHGRRVRADPSPSAACMEIFLNLDILSIKKTRQ